MTDTAVPVLNHGPEVLPRREEDEWFNLNYGHWRNFYMGWKHPTEAVPLLDFSVLEEGNAR